MAWTTPKTWDALEEVIADDFNTHIRNNLLALWVGTTAGDMDYYSSATAKTRIAIGSAGKILKSNGSVPLWELLINGRRGGSSTDWSTVGTTGYTPAAVSIQCGALTILDAGSAITFPVAFSNVPLLFLQMATLGSSTSNHHVWINTITASGATVGAYDAGSPGNSVNAFWLAIGPE